MWYFPLLSQGILLTIIVAEFVSDKQQKTSAICYLHFPFYYQSPEGIMTGYLIYLVSFSLEGFWDGQEGKIWIKTIKTTVSEFTLKGAGEIQRFWSVNQNQKTG